MALEIDFVSDIACPWCAVGLHGLLRALERLPDLAVTLRFQPFELNPHMAPEGEDAIAHLQAKYGLSVEQLAQNREVLRERGAAVGFQFGPRPHVWNTFHAHRLLHAAGLQDVGTQLRLKQALLQAYHGDARNPGDAATLREVATAAGLQGADAVIDDPLCHAEAVRQLQAEWMAAGIRAVPAVVINGRHLISGGQPPEVYEQALRQLAETSISPGR